MCSVFHCTVSAALCSFKIWALSGLCSWSWCYVNVGASWPLVTSLDKKLFTTCVSVMSLVLWMIPLCLGWNRFCTHFWWTFPLVISTTGFLSLQSATFRGWADYCKPPCSLTSCGKTWGWLIHHSRKIWLCDPSPTSCCFLRGQSKLLSHQIWQLEYSFIL